MTNKILPLFLVALLVGACGTVPDVRYRVDAPGPHPDPVGDEFVRYDGYEDVAGTLRISETTYARPGTEAKITLVGVVHVGDAAYYEAIQERLDRADLVLFELVKPASLDVRRLEPGQAGGMYGQLADLFGLAEQMTEIDYRGDNFQWLDMSAEVLQARVQAIVQETVEKLTKRFGGKGASLEPLRRALGAAPPALVRRLAAVLLELDRLSLDDPPADPISQLIGLVLLPLEAEKAFYGTFRTEKAFEDKYQHMMATGLGAPEALDLAGEAADDELTSILTGFIQALMGIILVERNQVVLDGIERLLEGGQAPADVVVFYGAAHNRGLSAGLIEMGFAAEGGPIWHDAISIEKE